MNWSTVTAIAARDARAGLRNRWFVIYATIFVAMIVAFSWVALAGSDLTGQAGFGRTSAGLLNLLLLLVPLIGLTVGAQAIVADRQDRSLDYLLAQPVSPAEVYTGKYIGAAVTLILLILFGFGWAGVVLAFRGSAGRGSDFLTLALLTIILGLGMLSVGFLISSFSPQTSAALGIAVSLWLVFVILGDLGVMGSSLVMSVPADTLLWLTMINPLDVYKLVSVGLLHTSVDVLGPAGLYATDQFGSRLNPLLLFLNSLWIVIPLGIGYWLFRRVDFR